MSTFQALVASKNSAGSCDLQVLDRSIDELPPGDVLIRVHYSSLNYKDALSATGHPGITRHYPHTPGIDAAGIVAASQSPEFALGDRVIVTGFDLGVNTAGGFAEYIRVPSAWVVPCPAELSLRESMAYGTAGFTAALCVQQLQRHDIRPEHGKILVTGATGGVGSLAIGLLAKLGYEVVAVTGKSQAETYLKSLGASAVIARQEMDDRSGKALLKSQYVGAIDTVGGNVLATVIKQLAYGGVVTACGMAMSAELITSVYPFILRGVSLVGVDSVAVDRTVRLALWQTLATSWKLDSIEKIITEIKLSELPDSIQTILAGNATGRAIVNVAGSQPMPSAIAPD